MSGSLSAHPISVRPAASTRAVIGVACRDTDAIFKVRRQTGKIRLELHHCRSPDGIGCLGDHRRLDEGVTWQAMAWRIHGQLPYSELQFFPKPAAFSIGWHEQARRRITSFANPKDC